MSQINNVTQISGYTTEAYQQMVGVAKQHNVSETELAALLLQEGQGGKSFNEACAAVLPSLSAPRETPAGTLNHWVAVASPLAGLSAMISELSAEQRKENREIMKAQTDSIVMSMEQQADEIRKKAVAQLACGIVSGAINIGMGAVQFGMGVKQLTSSKGLNAKDANMVEEKQLNKDVHSLEKQTKASTKEVKSLTKQVGKDPSQAHNLENAQNKLDINKESLKAAQKDLADLRANAPELTGAQRKAANKAQSYGVMGQSMSQLGQGVSGIINSIGGYVGAQYDAAIKEMDAAQEQMRANRDALKSITDGLSELIQKALSTQDAIQQNMNQTRSRILG